MALVDLAADLDIFAGEIEKRQDFRLRNIPDRQQMLALEDRRSAG